MFEVWRHTRGSDRNALCKVLLDERIYDQKRCCRYYYDTVLKLLSQFLLGNHGITGGSHLVGLIHQHQITKHYLQRHSAVILQIHQSIKELIPHSCSIEKSHNCDDRTGERNGNFEEKAEV